MELAISRNQFMFIIVATMLLQARAVTAQEPSASAGPEISMAEIIGRLHEAQQRTLQAPGGLSIDYTLEVEQDKKEPYFVWEKGLTGTFVAKWPLIRSRVEGEFFGISELQPDGKVLSKSVPLVREANYNFEEQVSIARDGVMVGQIGNFRHSFSSSTCYPFMLQCYEQMNQFYVPGSKDVASDYWLPSALQKNSYKLVGTEDIEGVKCHLLERAGFDRIWLALDHGCALCQREINYGVGEPLRERLHHKDLQQVADGIWIPHTLSQELRDVSGKKLMTVTVTVTKATVGSVRDEDVQVVLDGSMRQVEDFITGRIFNGNGLDDDRFQRAVKAVTKPPLNRRSSYTMVLANIAALLVIVIVWLRMPSALVEKPA